MRHFGCEWETFHIIPIESGRGCPYGCEFCTVTGFFGDSIRFRTNQSIVDEMLKIKERAKSTRGKVAVFFVDDNFAINVKRTKSLLRDIIAAGAELSWVGQISANLLKDQELLDLIAASGGKWIFIGMESLDPANLASVNKSFNKPADYANVLQALAKRHVYAITSFIFGLDNDTTGRGRAHVVADSRLAAGTAGVRTDHSFPATPLYDRLLKEGRLTRPKHWLEFAPFQMAHTPLKISIPEVQDEVRYAWANSYSPAAIERAIDSIADEPAAYKISHLIARLFFRGIYFPQKGKWLKLLFQNRRAIRRVVKDCFHNWHGARGQAKDLDFNRATPPAYVPDSGGD